MNNFKFITEYKVDDILETLRAAPSVFNEETWRKDHLGSSHTDVETAFIRYPVVKTAYDVFQSEELEDRALYFKPSVKDIILSLANYLRKNPARAIIAKLKPKGVIKTHIDQGKYADMTERYHIALETNSKSYLSCGEESLNIPQGHCYWFNKHIEHSAINEGATPRLHLIVDFWRV